MEYKIGTGANVPLVDLVTLDPQPRCEGLQYGRITHTAGGGQVLEAPHAILLWDMIESESDYAALLTQFGLNSATTAMVTVTLPNALYESTRYNGRAVRPVAGQTVRRNNFFVREVAILVRGLVVAA